MTSEQHLSDLLARFELEPIAALGSQALQRLLDAKDGKALPLPQGADPRDFEDAIASAIAVFGSRDLDGVLAEVERRGWNDRRVVLCGLGQVRDPRIVAKLVELFASKDAFDRARAVGYLGAQRDPRATATLIKALADRAESVRAPAVEALGDSGESSAIPALQDFAKRAKPWLADAARAAVARIRKAKRTR